MTLYTKITGFLAVSLVFFCALVASDFGEKSWKLRVDPSIKSLLPNSGDEIKFLKETQDRYSSDDLLLVSWVGDEIFTPRTLSALKNFTKQVESIAGVVHVESLATAIETKVYSDYTEVSSFLAEVPKTNFEAESIKKSVLSNPLYAGYLVSGDGKGVMVSIRFDRSLTAQEMINKVRQISHLSKQDAGLTQQFLSGPLYVRLEISRLLLEDLYRVMPMAILVSLLVLFVGFRNLRGVILPFLANAASLVATFLIFVANGNLLNYILVILPPTIYVVGFAYSVHVVAEFEKKFVENISRKEAVLSALRSVLTPILLTALTTAIGFFSLSFSAIDSISTFGLYASLGTIISCAFSLIIVPFGLSIFAVGKRRREISFDNVSGYLSQRVYKNTTFFVVSGFLFGVVSIFGLTKISVGTNYLDNFSRESETYSNFNKLSNVFAGSVPLQVVLQGPSVDFFKEPRALAEVHALQSWLLEQPEIGGVYSLLDYVSTLEEALAPDRVDDNPVPTSSSLVSHYILLGATEDIRRFADASFSNTLLQVRARVVGSAELNALSNKIEKRLAEMTDQNITGRLTGSSYLIARTLDEVTRGQVISLIAAILPIYLILSLLFKSLFLGFVALIPNVLPILVFFGILGLAGIPLNLTTSLVASVVLGIAVDDSIHFFVRFREAINKSHKDPLFYAISSVLKPVTFTTIALALGFLTLITGQLLSQGEFGILVAITLVVAWILDLTFTPALARFFRIEGRIKTTKVSKDDYKIIK